MWRNDKGSYGAVSVALHWIVAVLFLCQIPLGYLTQATANSPALQFDLYQWHKSLGILVLLVGVPRLVWALMGTRPDLPEGLSRLEQGASHAAHAALYGLTILVPLAGWAIASTSPLNIPTYAFNLVVVPDLPLPVSDAGERLWSVVHASLAYLAASVAALHILAALWHHFYRKDEVLQRMLSLRRTRGRRH